jgi:undecaprenyl diphosphate synthase
LHKLLLMTDNILANEIDREKLPRHIAIIMDGNGRWAKMHGKARVFGHKAGVKSVRKVTEAAAQLGVEFMTLYAFSTENWNRPRLEVEALMLLLVETINTEIKTLHKNNIRLKTIGNIDGLPEISKKALLKGIETTKDNSGMTLILALNYSGHNEIVSMVKSIAEKVESGSVSLDQVDAAMVEEHLYTHGIPSPELLIRTSGEFRISNFLLWQIAYSEFYFSPLMWPDFGQDQLYEAVIDYQSRERRFGKTSEQVKK